MITTSRVCGKCGAHVYADAPQGFCSACLFETALGVEGDGLDGSTGDIATRVLTDFGDYDLLSEIGRGGQGVVYKARQKSLNRTVALKVIGLGHWATPAHLKRFRLEAKAAASLEHPSVVPIYEVGERDGACFFSMKFVDGSQLDKVIEGRPMLPREAAELIVKLAHTVQYAHEHGVLHRDIKPGNILIDAAGLPHLTDFGLARLIETESTITRTLEVLGTPSYIAPEQATGESTQVSAATDVYGLGAVLYQLLTGQPPFASSTTYETIRLVLETEPRRPRLWNVKVDRDLETICLKCLEKDPGKRYPTALGIAEDLEHWLRHEPIRARRSGPFIRARKWGRRNRATAVFVPALAVLTIAAGVLIWKAQLDSRAEVSSSKSLAIIIRSADANTAVEAREFSRDLNHFLSRLAGLRVVERSQVLKWEVSAGPIENIEKAFGTSSILLGQIRQVDNNRQFTFDLVGIPGRTKLWSHSFTTSVSDWESIRSQIARGIIDALQIPATEADQSLLRRPRTKNQTALLEYYNGRRDADVEDAASLQRAALHFDAAIREDPNFAQAYAGLAQAYLDLAYSYADPTSYLAKAREAVKRALAIDETLPEAKIEDGLLKFFFEWDWAGAQRAVSEAVRTDLSAVQNNACYLHSLDVYGRGEEALKEVQRALALSPSSPTLQSELGCAAYYAGLFSQAAEYSRACIQSQPDNPMNYWLLARTLAQLGDYPSALINLHLGQSKPGGSWSAFDAELAYVYARLGQSNEAGQTISSLQKREETEFVDPYLYAMAYSGLGDADKVFENLNKACDRKSSWCPSILVEPKFKPFQNDVRFKQVLARMKLPASPMNR